MDNLSHSVVSLVAGELIHRLLPVEENDQRRALRQRLLLTSAWLAGNFPDLDLFFTHLIPPPLGYLLHHRGHTHTLLYLLPQAFLIWAMIWLAWPAARQLLKESKPVRRGFALALAAGLLLHICMDYLNSYGVHPFPPVNSNWFYGDMVFIVEPLFWLACGIPLAMLIQRRRLGHVMAALLLGSLVYFAVKGFLWWISLAVLLGLAFVLGAVQRRSGERRIAGLSLSLCVILCFIGVQATASHYAADLVAKSAHDMDRSSRLRDVALTAFPFNPVCWVFVTVESNEIQGIYRLRRGLISIAPKYFPVLECPSGLLGRLPHQDSISSIIYLEQHERDLELLRMLKGMNCHVDAWLRFARAPLMDEKSAEDLRFSSGLRGNFTTMKLEDINARNCPRRVPEWNYPRSDLLIEP